MITYFQALVLGLLQGIAELFPISSLGHSVIVPALLGWHNAQANDNAFLTFLVATHFATAIVLLVFYGRAWAEIIRGMFRSLRQRQVSDAPARLGWLLVVGTVPAGVLGVLFQDQLRALFVSARVAALFLFLNGLLLLGAEALRQRAPQFSGNLTERLARLTWWQAAKVGAAQAAALIPGLSRSGASMAGGLLLGLSDEDAVHLALLMATPIIFGAALLKLPDLFQAQYHGLIGPSIVGALAAAAAATVAVRWLTRFVKTNKLTPFGIYCLLAGGLASLLLFR